MGALRMFSMLSGVLWSLVSILCLMLSLYLLFGDPIETRAQSTYSPSMEDIGPLALMSILALIINLLLIGSTLLQSRSLVLLWILYKLLVIVVFWLWFGYSQLKHYGYISGMHNCVFCGLVPEENYVSFGGAVTTFALVISMLIVTAYYSSLKKLTRRRRRHHHHSSHPYLYNGHEMQQEQYLHHHNQMMPKYHHGREHQIHLDHY